MLEARDMLFPKSDATIIDAWHVRGLRGTGSHHFAVKDLFVPQERTVWSYADPVLEPSPLYLYPMGLLTQHMHGRLAHYESVGQCFLGLEPEAHWF
jgi:hypothetical protein